MANRGLVMRIDRAMLGGAFGFVSAGAAASVHRGVAVDLLQQRISAIGNAAADDPQRAALADGGAGFPIGMNRQCADAAEPGGGEFADRFQ